MSHPFRAAVENHDPEAMAALMAPDIAFFSPVAHRPFTGREAVTELFWNLFEVFENFEYTDELEGDRTHALIFRANVNGKRIEGLDHLQIGADGLVHTFTVMMRPLSGLAAMGEAMGPRVGHLAKGEAPA